MTQTDRDEPALAALIAENLALTAQLEKAHRDLGEAQLRIIQLERELGTKRPGENMRKFEEVRSAALANGRRGVFQS